MKYQKLTSYTWFDAELLGLLYPKSKVDEAINELVNDNITLIKRCNELKDKADSLYIAATESMRLYKQAKRALWRVRRYVAALRKFENNSILGKLRLARLESRCRDFIEKYEDNAG